MVAISSFTRTSPAWTVVFSAFGSAISAGSDADGLIGGGRRHDRARHRQRVAQTLHARGWPVTAMVAELADSSAGDE
jgi:hypothetical protein